MNAADNTYMQGFADALTIAHATADRIAASDMHILRREMAAEALRAFADEASKAIVEAPDWQGPAHETCRQSAWVAKSFETVRRRTDLSFKHHAEVAALPPAEADALPISTPDASAAACLRGYVGEACPDCANFTLVRNGTCLKCDTCGSTTGCS